MLQHLPVKDSENPARDASIGLKDVKYDKTVLTKGVSEFSIPLYEEIFTPAMRCHPFYQNHDQIFEKERFLYSSC